MNYSYYEIAMLFFAYSFFAWLAETSVATIKEKDFRNRGFASGPFCFIYGFTGVLLTVFLQELKHFLFIFRKHGGCNCRGVVYRKMPREDETKEMVGLFAQEMEF